MPDISVKRGVSWTPRAKDLVITRTWDGLTFDQSVQNVRAKLTSAVAPENERFVKELIAERVLDMQIVLNNVFTAGTPNQAFVNGLGQGDLTLLASMDGSKPIVYEFDRGSRTPLEHYTRDDAGRFVALRRPPNFVVMRAEVTLAPMGLRMTYPTWKSDVLGGPLTTIQEYGG